MSQMKCKKGNGSIPMNAKKEAHIIARVQDGETELFADLVRYYQTSLLRVVTNMLEGSQVEDVVQEVFLAAFKNIGTYSSDKGLFRTWLFRIARNKTINALKKKKRETHQKMPELIDRRTPAEKVLRKEVFLKLDQALSSLKPQDRMIFVWAELEELPYAEIARIEGLPLGTVKSRLFRTKAKLKTLIASYVSDDG
jgi:RNA polymerase sigma-70 factor (ECF subfamily)